MNKKIIMIRNSDFKYDSKMKKEANASLKIGFDVTVLSWVRDNTHNQNNIIKLKDGDVKIEYFNKYAKYGAGFKNIFNILLYNIWILWKLIKSKQEYKILIAYDFDVIIPTYIYSKIYKRKIIFNMVDSYAQNHPMPKWVKKIITKIENKFINIVDAVIVCNEVRNKIISKENPKECIILHNSPDLEAFTSKLTEQIVKKNNKFKVVYVGTLTPKGRLLAEILKQVENLNIELHIAGFGPLEAEIKKLVMKNSNIIYYGQIENETAIQLQSECNLLFATYDPSIEINKYSAPLKLYEAMALCKPIIVCRGTTSDEIVIANSMGKVIDYSANEFWDAVSSLAKNPKLCQEMGINGRKAFNEQYDWKIMEKRLQSLYEKLN
jgi:glycosyltransferase involved in cell wall biosynthesis